MDQFQRNILGNKITEAAFFYGKTDLSKEQASALISVMEKFLMVDGFEALIKAIDRYVADTKNKTFFSPATLRPYLNPELSPEAKANEVASRIRSAVGKFGWCNPEEARAYIGGLGWLAIDRAGGWQYVCENLGIDLNVLTFHAQIREQVKAIIETQGLGQFDQPIQIEQRTKSHDPDFHINERKRDQALAMLEQLKKSNNLENKL